MAKEEKSNISNREERLSYDSSNDIQAEARNKIKEKRGIDVLSDDLFADAKKIVLENEQLKNFYMEQKEVYKDFINKSLDGIVKHINKIDIRIESDELFSPTGTLKEYFTAFKHRPLKKCEDEIKNLEDIQEKLSELEKVYKNKINEIEDRCKVLHSRSETVKNALYQEAKRALQAEREIVRLKNDLQKANKKYQRGKISYQNLMEKEYELKQEIRKQRSAYRVAYLAMEKEKIPLIMSGETQLIIRCVVKDFYYVKLCEVKKQLEEVESSYNLIKSASDLLVKKENPVESKV